MKNAKRNIQNVELIRRFRGGDDSALGELVEKNWGLIEKIADRIGHQFMDFEDRCQEGYIGFMKAVDHYREMDGSTFSTYAIYWIDQEIRRAIKNKGYLIRVPCYLYHSGESVPPESKRYPSFEKNTEHANRAKTACIGDIMLMDISDDRDDMDLIDTDQIVHHILGELVPKEREVLDRYYLRGETLKEIGIRLGVGKEWIRQIRDRALQTIRSRFKIVDGQLVS